MTQHGFLYLARGCNSPSDKPEIDHQRISSGSFIDPLEAICRDIAHAYNLKTKKLHALRSLKQLWASILSPLNQSWPYASACFQPVGTQRSFGSRHGPSLRVSLLIVKFPKQQPFRAPRRLRFTVIFATSLSLRTKSF